MTLNERQKKIIRFAQANDNKITKKQAVELIGDSYYYNGEKYVGEILSRLVKNQALKRIKPGHYEILTGAASAKLGITAENQIPLF